MGNSLSTNLGVVFFCVSAMTYSEDLDFEDFSFDELKGFKTLHELTPTMSIDDMSSEARGPQSYPDEIVILGFAEKYINSSTSLDPDIQRIIQKRFWDLI